MADLGDSSMAHSSSVSGGPGHKATSWMVVGIITVAAVVLGVAFVMRSLPLAIVGGVILLGGIVLGAVSGIMEDVH
jgi:hypothetical protein